MQDVGTVISFNGPSSSEFWFVLKNNSKVRKGQLVQLKTNEGLLVARIAEIIKTNRYFSRAESVSEFEKSGKPITEQFPIERWEYLVAQAIPLGIFIDGKQERVSFPPSPGDKVFLADQKILKDFFGFDDNGLNIGKIEFHDLDAKLNMTRLLQKHLAILAMSGSGKSYLASVIIEELVNRKNGPAVIVIDPHGEYTAFEKDEKYSKKTRVWKKDEIKIATHKLSSRGFLELIPQMSSIQARELTPIIRKIKKEKKVYDLSELIKEVEENVSNPKTKGALIAWLNELRYTKLFSNEDSPSLHELVRPNQISIIDLSDFIHLREKQIIVNYFANKLFFARRKNLIPPFVLFVEEAHQFAPEKEESSKAISKPVIEQIAREGRKFYASLVLISQRPIRLSTTALSQCNTHIIMRVTNPYDLQHIGESSEGITKDVIKMIPGLKVGEAFIIGEAINYPALVKIRKRNIEAKENEKNLEEALEDYYRNKKEVLDLF